MYIQDLGHSFSLYRTDKITFIYFSELQMYKEAPSKILNWTYKDTIRTSQPVNNVYICVSPKNTLSFWWPKCPQWRLFWFSRFTRRRPPPSPPKKSKEKKSFEPCPKNFVLKLIYFFVFQHQSWYTSWQYCCHGAFDNSLKNGASPQVNNKYPWQSIYCTMYCTM